MPLLDNELTVDFNHLMMNGFTAENAEVSQREGREKEERGISIFLFFLISLFFFISLFFLIFTLRDLSVLCASAVSGAFEIINSNNSYEIRSVQK